MVLTLTDLVDLAGESSVSFLVDLGGGLGARRLHETKHPALRFVDPVTSVVHPVLSLDLQVLGMRLSDGGGGHSLHLPVLVQIQWHGLPEGIFG